jgi:hypothetical protein
MSLYLDNMSLVTQGRMWIKHDRAPLHFGREVMGVPHDSYHGRWLGSGGLVPWPPRSPDFSQLDFFLSACLQSRVHQNGKPETRQQLVQAINGAAVGVRNKLEHMHWGQSVEQGVAACLPTLNSGL